MKKTSISRGTGNFRSLLLSISVIALFSFSSNNTEQKAIIELRQTSPVEAFRIVEKIYQVKFTYDPEIIQSGKKINLSKRERTLSEVLENLTGLTGLRFMQIGKMIGVHKLEIERSEKKQTFPPITITAIVTDGSGQPLPGVTINVRGKSQSGAVTNDAGEFTITVDQGDVLLVSYVGYVTQEITAGSDPNISISLLPTGESLDEVVVTTALGIKKEKIRTTYAMQEVKGTVMEKAREPNVMGNLTGKVAGLSIQNKSTLFENPEFTLRGGSTLVVIDGVPASTDFWNINADDVDNVNVLKGTAATALYGSLGINGAIMITTKKGKAGKNGVEVSFNSSNQFQGGFLNLPEAQTEYGMGWNGQYSYKDGRGGGLYDDYGYVYGPKLNQPDPGTASGFVEYPQHNSPIDPVTGEPVPLPWITRSQSNLKKFLRNQMLTTNNISIAGKHDNGDYRISLTHLYQKGQVPNTHVNATTLSMAGSLRLSEKLRVEATLSYNKQYSPNFPTTGYGPDNMFYNILLWMGPEVDINDLKNYWVTGREGVEQDTYNYTWYNNPWFLAMERPRNYQRDAIVAQANAVYDFNKDLSFMVRSGATVNNSNRTINTPWSFINYGTSRAPNGNFEIWKQNQIRIVSDAMLTYKKDFNDFNAVISAGASSRYDHVDESNTTTNGLSVPGVYNLGNSINPVIATNLVREKQVNSLLGYAELSYRNQIFLNLSGRNDWSSALQKPYNSFFYPSASVGIVASEMVRLPQVFSFLKFRGSWANISTDIISIDETVPEEYATLPVYVNGVRWNGQSSLNLPGRLIAPGIRPNKTISQEYGTEMRFLNNRLGLDFTYYSYMDKDFVVAVPISEAAGYDQLIVNGDRVQRKGIEIMLTGSPIRNPAGLRWDVAVNYSMHRSIQREFYGGDSIRDLIEVGGRTDLLLGYKWDRSPDGQVVYVDGIPQYVNARTKLGNTNPDWEFGVVNSFSFKNFSLSFQFDGRIGGYLVNGVEAKLYEGGMHKSTANQFRDDAYAGVDSYVGQGVVATSGAAEYDAFGRLLSDTRKFAPNDTKVNYINWVFASYTNGIEDAILYKRSFVKLREVVITYNLGPRLMTKLPFKTANISLVGRNLLMFTKVPYMDPDGYTGTTLAEPSYRNIGVNLNLKF